MSVIDLNIAPFIFCWKINESESDLTKLTNLSKIEELKINNLKKSKRRKELLATRALLATLIPNDHIHYNNKNPFLLNSKKEISISNSKDYVVIQLKNQDELAGIDIQFLSKTVLKVKHKFLNPLEFHLCNKINEIKILNIIWSAKETLYKAYSEEKLNFKKQIVVTKINNNSIEGFIERENYKDSFKLGLHTNNEFVLTWF